MIFHRRKSSADLDDPGELVPSQSHTKSDIRDQETSCTESETSTDAIQLTEKGAIPEHEQTDQMLINSENYTSSDLTPPPSSSKQVLDRESMDNEPTKVPGPSGDACADYNVSLKKCV